MNYADFIATAWNDHADDAAAVAARLAEKQARPSTSADIVPFARLVTHVYGEHLARWQAGIELLASLRTLPAWDDGADCAPAVARGIAVLHYASACTGAVEGRPDSALEMLPADEQAIVLASAASALAGQHHYRRAITAYRQAIAIGEQGLPDSAPAVRALAIAGDNLAAALEEKADRDAFETEGMFAAAHGGLQYWKRAGGWLEEERAEYRLARSGLAAQDGAMATDHARRCIAVCEANDAPAFERFFGHAVLALARRATGDDAGYVASRQHALALHVEVPADERRWCAREFGELGGTESPSRGAGSTDIQSEAS